MRRLLAIGSLIYCVMANAQSLLVVQSATVNDLYGNTIIAKILEDQNGSVDHIAVFNARQFTHDRSAHSREILSKVLRTYVEHSKPSALLFLGEPIVDVGIPTQYSSVLIGSTSFNTTALKAASIYNKHWSPVYVISDNSVLANLRLQELRRQLDGIELDVTTVSTVIEYRQALLDLQDQPKGTLVLNAFSLLDEWQDSVGFAEIENLLVKTNRRHVDVGICRNGFKTTLAIGPTPAEAAALATAPYSQASNSHISSCANLSRVVPKWLGLYRATMGKYDIVEGGNQ
ncbi:hypothetical protein O152_gp233 [Pseudomonas phage PaBG]|uniref:Uncharacterized protein n=1 Tax=Pseudomonas phage PaBG TaxID=1335230 RepID=S5WBG1_9CAUD|nr:hypothetical protein O152_gp233 [Pseudomonas phage PaBG]AGS82128.1 hypothetical protein PaBG_00253 [Pseudomonas phage PaBG]